MAPVLPFSLEAGRGAGEHGCLAEAAPGLLHHKRDEQANYEYMYELTCAVTSSVDLDDSPNMAFPFPP